MLSLGLTAATLLVATWVGYPLLIRALGSLRRPLTETPLDSAPSVSIVLATRDDADAIRARVSDLLLAEYPAPIEIIVALDATRETSPTIETFGPGPLVRAVPGDAPGGKAAALNAGVRAAKNEILVFTDTAQRFEPGAVAALVARLQVPGTGAVSGMLDRPRLSGAAPDLAERYWLYERWLRRWEARVHSCVGVTGAIYAMPRNLWEPLPSALILDDLYLPMRLAMQGWRIGFTADARALDVRQFAPAQEYRRKVRTLTGVIQVCAWLPGVLNPIRNPIWLQFVFHKLLRLLTPYLALLAVLGIAASAIQMLLSWREGVTVMVVCALLLTILCVIPRVRRILKAQLAWGFALQSSVVMATVNGVRGKWDVWR